MSSMSDMSSILTLSRHALPKGPVIDIRLHEHFNSKIYNSGSPVSGEVVISPCRDTRFDYVTINLVGSTHTRLDISQIAQYSSHTFLKLTMPIPDSAYPTPRVFEAGQTYIIPFNFVIPEHLTLGACTHTKRSQAVHAQHMRLPPSTGHWGKDDLSPVMARVEYVIKARVADMPELAPGARPIKLLHADRRINVLPSSIEDPPLDITPADRLYKLSKTKTIRKNLFSSKQGSVTATAIQPEAIRVKPDFKGTPGSSVRVDLEFEPSSAANATNPAALPNLNHASAKLQASTWFSSCPMVNLPDRGDSRQTCLTTPQLSYSTSVPLFSSAALPKTSWEVRNKLARRDSGYSSEGQSEEESASSSQRRGSAGSKHPPSPITYRASVQIPFSVTSTRRVFLPTFHTCLASRTYIIQLTLILGDTKMNLAVPVQVVIDQAADQMLSVPASPPTFDAVMAAQEEADADAMFRPRVLRQPELQFERNAGLPGYADLNPMRAVLPVA